MADKFTRVVLLLFAISTWISQSAMDAFASLFVLGFLWMLLEKYDLRVGFRTLNWNKFWIAWFGVFALSYLVNWNSIDSVRKLFDFRWLILAMMMGSVLIAFQIPAGIWKIVQVFFVICSLYAVLVFVLKKNPLEPEYTLDILADGTVRTGGFLQQPIVFAHLYGLWVCLFAGILLVIFDNNKRKAFERSNIWLHLAIVCGTVGVLLSFTRGVWLALFWALFAIFFVVRKKMAFGFLLFIAGAAVVLTMTWPPVRERVMQSFNAQDSERFWIWKANFEIFKDYPLLGPGYNQNVRLLPEYLEKIQAPEGIMISHAHNEFLHVLAGTGIFGLLSYLAFWFALAVMSVKTFSEQRLKSLTKAGVALGIFGAIICFLLGGITESNFEHSKIRYTWAMLVALLIWAKSQSSAFIPKK